MNTLSDIICRMSGVEDLTHLDFILSLDGSGSAGSFYKAIDNNFYYKLSYLISKDRFCYESVNEVVVSRLCTLFGFNNAGYKLIHAKIKILSREYETFLCRSVNFKRPKENRITLETFCKLNNIDHNNIDNFKEFSFFTDLLNMLLTDYIVNNRDRHGANIELLISDSGIRLAPIYDAGSSLLAPLQYDKQRIKVYNMLSDGPVNNYLISIIWEDVLDTLKCYHIKVPNINFSLLRYSDLYDAFGEDRYILDKEVEMIKVRYNHAKEVLNS